MSAEILQKLVDNLLKSVDEIQAVVVTDRDGLIIVSRSRGDLDKDEEIGATTAMFDNFLSRIKKDFGSVDNFMNITIIDNQKILFTSAGPNAILTVVASKDADDTKLRVYCEHISDKIARALDNEEIDPEIPVIVHALSKLRHGKIPEGEYSEKIIILGDPMVGKTSLIRRFVDNKFQENYISSIGVDITKKEVKLTEDNTLIMTIWDIGGQIQTMAPYRKRFYSGAEHAFLQFDITRHKTFENLDMWLSDLEKNVSESISKTIIANKIDKPESEWEVNLEEIEAKAKEWNCPYILTSAKTGENVNDAFRYAAYMFYEKKF